MTDSLLLLQLGSTAMLVGLIWTVQLVHYPLFESVGRKRFRDYHTAHVKRITWIVAPLMLLELLIAIGLVVLAPARPILWLGLSLVLLVFASTAFLQVPLHRALAAGPDRAVLRRLVTTNWIRTLAWSARGALALGLLAEGLDR